MNLIEKRPERRNRDSDPLEIVVASGKGGTGKTFLSSNLSLFLERELGGAVGVDADVEAPDLALALGGVKRVLKRREIWESAKAEISYDLCDGCGKCLEVCMFDALETRDSKPKVLERFCEGCGACSIVCPRSAINIRRTLTGLLLEVETLHGMQVVTGDLRVGGRNTGHLVYEAREAGKKLAREIGKKFVVIDAAPGIGCPVISSLSGADLLLLVVEPIPQSLQGAKRLLEVARAFKLTSYCILNKYDLNETFSERIQEELGLNVIGKVPYDEGVVESYTAMTPIILRGSKSEAKAALEEIFQKMAEELRSE